MQWYIPRMRKTKLLLTVVLSGLAASALAADIFDRTTPMRDAGLAAMPVQRDHVLDEGVRDGIPPAWLAARPAWIVMEPDQELVVYEPDAAAEDVSDDTGEGVQQRGVSVAVGGPDDNCVSGVCLGESVGKIYFDFDKAVPKQQPDPKVLGALKSGSRLVLVGHADEAGSVAYNLTLSARRAAAVLRQITPNKKVEGVALVAKGKSEPVSPDGALNRRVEIFIGEPPK